MPRLNHLLRPHRRGHSSSTNPASQQSQPTIAPSPPTTGAAPTLSSLPPLDIGSPDLGSRGQWFETKTESAVAPPIPPPPAPSTASATPAPTSTNGSRTSTPFTNLTSEINAPPKTTPRSAKPLTIMTSVGGIGHSLGAKGTSTQPQWLHAHGHSNSADRPEKVKESRKEKLNRLNPMSLLRRKSSNKDLVPDKDRIRSTRDLPEDFNPGTIRGTRHLDWSSPSKRGVKEPKRTLSPIPVGPTRDGGPLRPGSAASAGKEQNDRRISFSMSPETSNQTWRAISPAPPSPPPKDAAPTTPVPWENKTSNGLIVPTTKVTPATPNTPDTTSTNIPPKSPTRSFESSDPQSPASITSEGRRGVTLVDHPLSLPHHAAINASRFSFEGSDKAPSRAASVKDSGEDEDDDRYSFADDSFQFDLDDEEDDGFARANEGIFTQSNININIIDPYAQLNQLQAAVQSMQISAAQDQQGIGLALTHGESNGVSEEGTNFEPSPTEGALNSMAPGVSQNPQEVGVNSNKFPANPVSTGLENIGELDHPHDEQELDEYENDDGLAGYEDDEDPEAYQSTQGPVEYQNSGGPVGYGSNQGPVRYENNHGFAGYENDNGLAGYEDDEDDDLYLDDDINDEGSPDTRGQPALVMQPPTADATPEGLGSPNPSGSGAFPADPNAAHRFSFATTGLIAQDGSVATNSSSPITAFPPFINPIGGGLGYTPNQAQFYSPEQQYYAPQVNGTLLNGMALSSLTFSLQQYQHQQQALAGAPVSPSEGYDSDINDRPNFDDMSFDFNNDDYEGDDDMVAAANAEALAFDSDGFYGSEFGFYPSVAGGGMSYAGGFFGSAGANEILRPPIRRPSLTPISERSESSYRNSLVSPGIGGSPWGGPGPLSPGSWVTHDNEEVPINHVHLMQLRRNAWGGSNGSLRSSGSAGGSPVGSPVGWPVALAAVGMGTPPVMNPSPMNPFAAAQENEEPQKQQYGMISSLMAQRGLQEGQQYFPLGAMASSPLPHSPLSLSAMNPVTSPLNQPPGIGGSNQPSGNGPGASPSAPETMGSGVPTQGASESGFGTSPPPPGLHHQGSKAMLPTKGSFEDPMQQQTPAEK
ncbi:hypothetical protein BZA77DRAFT_299390 [Pyronema omphalodes]|nr:hypothetical protein BZA77DRAFT_299390 [Pyronema omphalodes]